MICKGIGLTADGEPCFVEGCKSKSTTILGDMEGVPVENPEDAAFDIKSPLF